MKRILLILVFVNALPSADVLTVDPGGTVIIAGAGPATPAVGEVRIGAGQVSAQGTVTAGEIVINRTTQASGAQAVRGDDQRMTNARAAAGGDAEMVQGRVPGAANDLATLDASGQISVTQLPNLAGGYILLEDIKATGVAGGAVAPATWVNRTFTKKTHDTGGHCSLNTSTNTFDLVAGTYRIEGSAYGVQCLSHVVRLQNITDNQFVIVGQSGYSETSGYTASTPSIIAGRFVITATKTFALQHYLTNGAGGGAMLGRPVSAVGVPEIYARLIIYRE